MAASDFYETLNRLGLSQYHDSLVQEAFDSWDILADITEEDLDAIGVKLGHRRILQRAIAEYRKEGAQTAPVVELPTEPKHRAAKSDGSISIPITTEPLPVSNGASRAQPTGSKRKYRRHPKPDDNAPDRPPSAYVLFSNQVREHLKGKDLSFTEIAKTVGERWQVLAPDEKATYESRSQAMKDHYYAQLAEYKKTQEYSQYQDYLADFKAKHEHGNAKRLKEAQPSPSRRSSDERASSPDVRESSANSSEQQYYERRRSTYDSARILNPVDWRPSTRSGHASPDLSCNSMQLEAAFSPRHTKPVTTFASINAPPQQNVPVHLKPSPSLRSNGHSVSPLQDHPMAISTSMAYGYHPMLVSQNSDSPPPTMPLARRPTLPSEGSLPSLRHSDSYGSSSAGSPSTSSGPNFSRAVPSRQLPLPFPSRQNSISAASQSLPPMKAPGSPGHYSPPSSGLATLLRAGEHLASTGGDMRIGNNYPDTMNHS
ncbi:hypothetical protein Q7P36_009076 [Cladosporium allicinum]